jgi:hypothetical protein
VRRLALLIALLSGCALPNLGAQSAAAIGLGGIDDLLGRVESINIYYGGNLDRRSNETDGTPRLAWAKDYGLEFLVHLGEFGPPSSTQRRLERERDRRRDRALDSLRIVRATRLEAARQSSAAVRDSIQRRFATDSARIVIDAEQPFVPTSITVRKHLSVVGNDTVLVSVDSELVGNRKPPEADEHLFDFDLGIGYGQMDGLVADGEFDLHGSVRELPSISAYVTASLSDRIGVYGGLRTGVITLEDAQLYVADGSTTSVYTLSSTSFEFGAPLGLDVKLAGDLHITAEVEYMRRIFNSLSTDPPNGFPSAFPRTLNLSGLSWSLGLQLPLR